MKEPWHHLKSKKRTGWHITACTEAPLFDQSAQKDAFAFPCFERELENKCGLCANSQKKCDAAVKRKQHLGQLPATDAHETVLTRGL